MHSSSSLASPAAIEAGVDRELGEDARREQQAVADGFGGRGGKAAVILLPNVQRNHKASLAGSSGAFQAR